MKMNLFLLLSLAIIPLTRLNAQSQNDTLVKFYSKEWIECTPDSAMYYGKLFKDGKRWHKKNFYISNNQIQMDGYAEDSDLSKRVDTFRYYFETGGIKEEAIYKNYRTAFDFRYYENGVKKYAVAFNKNRKIIKEESWKKD